MIKEKGKGDEPLLVDSVPEKQVTFSLKYFYFIIVAIISVVVFIVSRYYSLQNDINDLGFKYESLQKDISMVRDLEQSKPQANANTLSEHGVIVNYSTVELSSCQEIISAIQMLTAVRISKKCNEND